MARVIRRRHLRHGKFSRVRRGRDFETWLAQEQTDLSGTGTGVTITLSGGVSASTVLTLVANPTDGDTLTLGAKTYRFKTTIAQVNDVLRGADAAATIVSLVRAITAGAGAGTDYFTGTTANASVTAADGTGDTVDITAIQAGVAGNLIAVSETFTNAGNVLSGEYLTGGIDRYILNKATHGFVAGDGPFVITAGTTIPGGYTAGELLWVKASLGSDTFTMTTKRGGTVAKTFTTAGTGTLTLTKASTQRTVHELLKKRKPATISAETDIDNL